MIILKGVFGTFKFPEIAISWSDPEMQVHKFTHDFASNYVTVTAHEAYTYTNIVASVEPSFTVVVKPTPATFTPV